MKDTVTLTMLPVCECGSPIDVEVDGDGFNCLNVHIYPSCCPNCGANITSLQLDGKYVEMFLKGWSK